MCLSSVPVVLHTGTFVLTLNCVSIPNPCFVDFRYVNCVQYADTPDTLACFTVLLQSCRISVCTVRTGIENNGKILEGAFFSFRPDSI